MVLRSIMHCGKELDFRPRQAWPKVLPALAWNGQLVSGFERTAGDALEMDEKSANHFVDLWTACHPVLGLAELARLSHRLNRLWPELFVEWRESLFGHYRLRWSERLNQTLALLGASPFPFQAWVDDKKMAARDLSPLLALKDPKEITPLLEALPQMVISKFEGARALELVVELYLMGRPLNDLLPPSDNGALYVRRLEEWRRPKTNGADQEWKRSVNEWPWPAQVQAEWRREGDQAGLEIKIRTTSPDDFQKKLERMLTIPDTWSSTNN